MAKRLWEQLQMQNLNADNYDKNSDIYKLLTADAKSINDVVHDIAEGHAFYKPDGTNFRINLGSSMTINAEGGLQVDGIVNAPPTPVTPPYPSVEAPAFKASLGPNDVPRDVSPTEMPIREPIATVYAPAPEGYSPSYEGSSTGVEPSPAAAPAESVTPPNATEIGPKGFVNGNGVPINPDVVHIYQGPNGIYLYGGKISDGFAQDYAVKNNASVFVDKTEKHFWSIPTVVEYAPTDDGPPKITIHHGRAFVPDPKTFIKRLQ